MKKTKKPFFEQSVNIASPGNYPVLSTQRVSVFKKRHRLFISPLLVQTCNLI